MSSIAMSGAGTGVGVVSAIDSHTPKQIGEKGHVEYAWSNSTKEKILQVFFQMVRKGNESHSRGRHEKTSIGTNPITKFSKEFIEKHYAPLLKEVHRNWKTSASRTGNRGLWDESAEMLRVLFLMMIHARDTEEGKGERSFFYAMLYEWFKLNPSIGKFVLRSVVHLTEEKDDGTEIDTIPLGSWKDLKYFTEFVFREYKWKRDDPKNVGTLISRYAVSLYIEQLLKDKHLAEVEKTPEKLSLVARWIPRENSAFSWMFHQIAKEFYVKTHPGTLSDSLVEEKREKLRGVYASHLRKTISGLNRLLNTPQIDMCGKTWSQIDFKNVPSLTMKKHREAFLNLKKKKVRGHTEITQRSDEEDRVKCAENLKKYIEEIKKEGSESKKEIHGKKMSVGEFVKEAFKMSFGNSGDADTEADASSQDVLNLQWKSFMGQIRQMGNIIPLADVSGSMEGDPMMYSIGFSILLSEVASMGFKNRIMTFETKPSWVKLDDSMTFVEKVKKVKDAPWGGSTNFYASLQMILDACVENSVPPEAVKNLVLAVFSDMQIDSADRAISGKNAFTFFEGIKGMFAEKGYTEIPHILFWNLRSTDGFPTLSSTENTTMLSGFSASLLNDFASRGMEAIREFSPYESMVASFEKRRYSSLERIIHRYYPGTKAGSREGGEALDSDLDLTLDEAEAEAV
jgi:hypothetical protein